MVPASSSLIMKALDEPIRNRKEEKNGALLLPRCWSWAVGAARVMCGAPGSVRTW